ncbi:MAG: IMPACT family protein [Proteobacteria bacterium]|nr:MAG: IMPACT family protein [Pseudomonadota bacterium]PIE67527.1 MAG: IMPACT family protein [Deltaproteobacteria bacterium]
MMLTLASAAEYEEEIKKSRFIVKADAVASPDEAADFLERIRQARATHHCWAYKIGPAYRFSDDGEPAGTGGKPIWNAIERQGIDHVMVVVIRYFGGIKLGTGGLVRAYGGCAAKCLRQAALKKIDPVSELLVRTGFDHTGSVYAVVNRFKATRLAEAYTDSGIEIRLQVAQKDFRALTDTLIQACAGRIEVIEKNRPVT